MTWQERVADATKRFETAGIDSPELTATYLALAILGSWQRSDLTLKLADEVGEEASAQFEKLVSRRLWHEPLQYIIGEWEFYALRLYTTPAALIPRPETEVLVSAAIEEAKKLSGPVMILDIGTGTGAIALALAEHLPNAIVIGIDITDEAIALAERNKHRLNFTNVEFSKVDILGDDILSYAGKIDLLVSNPPYVSLKEWPELAPELLKEPRNALTDEADGLTFYKRILSLAPTLLTQKGRVLLELGHTAVPNIENIAREAQIVQIQILNDFAGIPRVFIGKKSEHTASA